MKSLQFDFPEGVLDTDLHFGIVPRWVARHPDLTAQAVRLYAVLADYANREGRSFPKRRTLAKACGGMGVDTVDRAMMLLITKMCMSVHHRPGRSSLYTIHRMPPGVRTGAEGSFSSKGTGADTSHRTGADTSKKTQLKKRKTEERVYPKEVRDRMWDALVAAFGAPVGGAEGRYGDAVTIALNAGILPADIGPARRRYLDHPRWQGAACSPQALLNNWNEFGPKLSPVRMLEIAEDEPLEPADPEVVADLIDGVTGRKRT